MGNKIEALAIVAREAELDATALLMRYQAAVDRMNKTKRELEEAVDEEVKRRRESL